MKRTLLCFILASTLVGGCVMAPPQQPPPALPQPEVQQLPKQVNGAIYQAGYEVRLYDDRIARRPGDLVTVIFEEETDAKKDAATTINKSSEIGIDAPTVGGAAATFQGTALSLAAGADREFTGEGESDQSNALKGTLTAMVIAVQPNGNMVIQGQKKLTLNQGDEHVTITGTIRREDVQPDNTISSTRVANAQIAYTGTGAMADANAMGWLSRLFYSVAWPF